MFRIILLLLIVVLFNCSLTEPCTLIIENQSDYTIHVLINDGNESEIILKKNKGDYVLVSPGQIKIEINIASIKYLKKYSIEINYLEKKKFIFEIQ